jgi:hypothetical protein
VDSGSGGQARVKEQLSSHPTHCCSDLCGGLDHIPRHHSGQGNRTETPITWYDCNYFLLYFYSYFLLPISCFYVEHTNIPHKVQHMQWDVNVFDVNFKISNFFKKYDYQVLFLCQHIADLYECS